MRFDRKQWEQLLGLAKDDATIYALLYAYECGNIDQSTMFVMLAERFASLQKELAKALTLQPPPRLIAVTQQEMDNLAAATPRGEEGR